jgi:Galactose-3-O-sulfotransferase
VDGVKTTETSLMCEKAKKMAYRRFVLSLLQDILLPSHDTRAHFLKITVVTVLILCLAGISRENETKTSSFVASVELHQLWLLLTKKNQKSASLGMERIAMASQISRTRRYWSFGITPLILWVILAINNKNEKSASSEIVSKVVESEVAASILSPHGIQQIGAGLARSFPVYGNFSWCTKDGYSFSNDTTNYEYDEPKGLIYVKVPKAASSTLAGVVDRIAYNNGMCDFQDEHVPDGAGRYYGNRDRKASFLLGSIRDPASRAISRIFFHQVSREGRDPTDDNIIKWLKNTNKEYGTVSLGQGGFQLNYMTLDPIPSWSFYDWNNNATVKNPKRVEKNVWRVVKKYDFLVVVERMDESLVVLSMLLGTHVGDVLTLDSKVNGMYFLDGARCFKIVKSNVSPRVKDYLSSDVWYAQNYGDYLLHAAASESLDRTIDALGRSRFEEELAKYQKLKILANDACASKASKCTEDGIPLPVEERRGNCYKGDEGCGYQCIDEIVSATERLRVQ